MRGKRLIAALIRLYPAKFRARYGAELRAFHEERVRGGASAWQWLRIILDHIHGAAAEHMRAKRAGGHAHSAHGVSLWAALGEDVRYAARALVRRPVFAAIVSATIALGVGANTAIFSVIHGVLLRPLPYPHAERVLSFGHEAPIWLASQAEYLDYQNGMRSLEQLSAYTMTEGNLATEQEPERVALASVTRNFFDALGVHPSLGRAFAEGEDLTMPSPLVIISHGLWQRHFAGRRDVIGGSLSLNGRTRTVIGVMPPDFDYPTDRTDVWLPMRRIHPDSLEDRANHSLFMVARLRPGVTFERAVNEANIVARWMVEQHSDRYDPNNPSVPVLERVGDVLLADTVPYLWTLFGAVGFVLLIVCANVANLLLARGEGRRKEMALRGALGASRPRLMAQLLSESLLLALAGGALGTFVAWSAQRALIALSPPSLPRLDEIQLDTTVLLYALLLSLVAGFIFGMVPAARVSRESPAAMLQQGGRSQRQGSSRRMRQSLVVAEVALAVVLLTGAGMLLRSLINLQSESLGFDTKRVLTAKVSLNGSSYDDARATLFYSQLIERVRRAPGVVAVGAAGWLPVVEAGGLWGVLAEGQRYEDLVQGPLAAPQQVTPGYFAAMGIPLLRGRDFTERDGANGPYVAVVSEAMAQQLWPDADPLGRRFRLGGGETYMTVVGIVGDIRARGFDDTPEPTMYFPHAQTRVAAYFMPRSLSLIIRTSDDPLQVTPHVRAAVRALDNAAPVSSVRTLDDVVGTAVASRRFGTTLITAFAAIALLLAAIGIFGVVSYGVSERTYEIGVRVALGAERSRILSLVIADSTRMAAAGIGIGLLGAALVARAIRSLLVDVPVLDPVTLISVCVLLGAVVVAATVLPARRATVVDPTEALRTG